MEAGQGVPERFTDPVRRLQERSGDEFNSRGGYVLPRATPRSRAGPGGSFQARKARSSPLALSQKRARRFGAVDHVAGLLRLPGFGQASQR